MTAVNDVTEETLRALAGVRAPEETVVSLYLDLDPARFATASARTSEIDSLLASARRKIERGERSHGELQALRRAQDRAAARLASIGSLAQGARAVAIFICEPLNLDRALRLPHPVASAVVISDAPFIAPLAETGPAGHVCVAAVDERFARILQGSPERLHERVSFGDPVHGRHDQGGWSQANYQRSIREDAEAHLRRVARELHDLLRVAPHDRLLIACAGPLWPRVVSKLHPDVKTRLIEQRLSIDVSDARLADVEQAAAAALASEQRAHEDAVLAALRERDPVGADARTAVGLQAVLRALVERRVESLLYDVGFDAPGVVCPRCGWMGIEGERCPVGGEQLHERENIVEESVRAAVKQSAEVLPLRDRPELGPLGRIAATLRF